MKKIKVLKTKYSVASFSQQVENIKSLALRKDNSFVVFAPSYDCVLAQRRDDVFLAHENAKIVCPDGFPIAKMMSFLGKYKQQRCSGPEIMEEILKQTENTDLTHYFYGSTQEVLDKMSFNLKKKYPNLKIAGFYSPPFRKIEKNEQTSINKMLNDISPNFIWVGLGAPKQQLWMNENYKELNSLLIGVGAAFDFLAETKPKAPKWMSKIGLEWFFRLLTEPRRLAKRYIVSNFLFIYYSLKQIVFDRDFITT